MDVFPIVLYKTNLKKEDIDNNTTQIYGLSLCRGVAWDFDDVRTRINLFSKRHRCLQLGGSGGMVPHKILKFRVWEMPSPSFSAGYFQ